MDSLDYSKIFYGHFWVLNRSKNSEKSKMFQEDRTTPYVTYISGYLYSVWILAYSHVSYNFDKLFNEFLIIANKKDIKYAEYSLDSEINFSFKIHKIDLWRLFK